MTKPQTLNWTVIVLTLAAAVAMWMVGIDRIRIVTNIMESLPQHDPALKDAARILSGGSLTDRVVVDIQLATPDPDQLVKISRRVETLMADSGLFEPSPLKDLATLMPELMWRIIRNLPTLFSAEELAERLDPLLAPDSVRRKLSRHIMQLAELEGFGKAELMAQDPLELRYLVLARLAEMAPAETGMMHQGHLISNDKKHLLLLARPLGSGADSRLSVRLEAFFDQVRLELAQDPELSRTPVQVTPIGAYRAALDNERIARKDTQIAVMAATAGISLLLLMAFPRPYIGLLSLLPAIFGTLTAFFVYALIFKSISILTIGFGGAIISITVDHGIVYLLFLDRPRITNGREAAAEVRAIGLAAALTSMVAFSMLSLSGFPILSEIGRFTAMGVFFSFVFVHTVFPRMIPQLPPAPDRPLPLRKFAVFIAQRGNTGKFIFAVGLMLVMIGFAWPKFHIDLSSMNTVSASTREAETTVTGVWGDILSRIYVMVEADTPAELLRRTDRLMEALNQAKSAGSIAKGFLPSMIFPGAERQAQNLRAWGEFWHSGRATTLRRTLEAEAVALGFRPEAFSAFFQLIERDAGFDTDLPQPFRELMNVSASSAGQGWVGVFALTPGPAYQPEVFYQDFSAHAAAFDPRFFAQRLGDILSATFIRMSLIIGASVAVFLLLFFRNVTLTLAALAPIVFALICTLGTLKLIGQPLDIPALMVAIVVFGMGVDYSLFLVRAYQRYGIEATPDTALIQTAIFLAAASTMIGFGVMGMAEHALLQSAGRASFFGIFFALVGAFCVLPRLLTLISRADARSGKGRQ